MNTPQAPWRRQCLMSEKTNFSLLFSFAVPVRCHDTVLHLPKDWQTQADALSTADLLPAVTVSEDGEVQYQGVKKSKRSAGAGYEAAVSGAAYGRYKHPWEAAMIRDYVQRHQVGEAEKKAREAEKAGAKGKAKRIGTAPRCVFPLSVSETFGESYVTIQCFFPPKLTLIFFLPIFPFFRRGA